MQKTWIYAAVVLSACGGGGSGDTTCALEARFSGAFEAETGSVACLTQFAPDIDNAFLPVEGSIETVELTIEGAVMGETAEGLVAAVRVRDDADGVWSSDACSVDIIEHTLSGEADLGRQYYTAVGTATCPPLASEPDDGPALTVEAFDFVVTPSW